MSDIFGVDGCPGGWIRVGQDAGCGMIPPRIFPDAASLLEAMTTDDHLGVDMPIGLPDAGPRDCDLAARAFLGRPRSASVFAAPVRPQLEARDHADAVRIGRAADGRGLSIQSWNIVPKIRELDRALRDSAHADRTYEVHPEVSFALWAGAPIVAGKRSPEGRDQRREIVERRFGRDAIAAARALGPKRILADDDILDAFAVLWSTRRIAEGECRSFPDAPPRDAMGLPMRILA